MHHSTAIAPSFPTLIYSLTHICLKDLSFYSSFRPICPGFVYICFSPLPFVCLSVQMCRCVMVNNCLQPFWIETSLIETRVYFVINGHECRTPFLASCQYCIYMFICNSILSAKTVWSQSVPPYRCLTLSPGPICQFIDLQLAHSALNYEHIEQIQTHSLKYLHASLWCRICYKQE